LRRINEQTGARRLILTGARRLALLLLLVASGALSHIYDPRNAHAAPAQSSAAKRSATPAPAPTATPQRPRYSIDFKLDFDRRTYTATERVRWVNRDTRPTSVLYFHLYNNLRSNANDAARGSQTTAAHNPSSASSSPPSSPEAAEPDEPRLHIKEVRAVQSGQLLPISLDEQKATLRVHLRESVAPGAATEIEIAFEGSVPELDPDETSLSAHVVQQVGAALRDTREWRRARDANFFSRGVMLLGTAYPVLAVRIGDDWQRKVEPSVGDLFFTEVADYEVTVRAPSDVALFTSGDEREPATVNDNNSPGGNTSADASTPPAAAVAENARTFTGENLRSFAIIAGRSLRVSERAVSGVRVRSIYVAEHERVGRRVLGVAAEAVRVFVERFGAAPYKTLTIAEAPLVAGVGSMEFAGLGVVASAFYVDFDAPATRHLPEIVREQRASVEDSLEFTTAHVVAHQWWGASVGNDPERAPVLDEALAHWSALLYYQEAHGAERAAQALDDQLRGVYQVYRTFGGDDMTADHSARDYRNSFQYAAIVASKGALMFIALRKQMGEERFWKALAGYYEANRFEIAEMDDLEAAFAAEVPVGERRTLTRLFNRWLSEKRGDEDIAPPNPQLAAALGLSVEQNNGAKDRNTFSRLGRFFWRQMTRIR
jgi:hypothetical protein